MFLLVFSILFWCSKIFGEIFRYDSRRVFDARNKCRLFVSGIHYTSSFRFAIGSICLHCKRYAMDQRPHDFALVWFLFNFITLINCHAFVVQWIQISSRSPCIFWETKWQTSDVIRIGNSEDRKEFEYRLSMREDMISYVYVDIIWCFPCHCKNRFQFISMQIRWAFSLICLCLEKFPHLPSI